MARKSWTKEQIEALKKSMRLHIDARINALLRDAHKLGYGKKEAIDAVVESLLFEIVGDENIPDVFKTSRGQDTLKSFIKSEVSVIIKERRKGWAERYKKIMTSDYSSEVKRKNIEKLEKYYFGKEEMEEIRKKEEEKRKRKREFEDFTMEERARILREKGKERREGILEGLEDVEEGPWTREGFEGLSLAEKERLREEWYKKRRKEYKRKKKKYKEEHGAGRRFAFWKKDEELRKAREKLGKEKGKLGKYRDIAYGEANPEKVEEYEGKKREYKEFKDKLRTGEIYKDMGIAEARQRELELKKEVKELRKEAKGKRWKRAARFAGRTAAGPGKFAKGAKSLVMKGFVLACFVGFGAVVTVAIGLPFVFFLGFLGWGLYYLLPDPNDFKVPDEVKNLSEDNPLRWYMVNPLSVRGAYVRNKHTGWGVLRSFVKIGVFACFIIGVYTTTVPLGNIALIILAFFGYYSLKITYDVERPYELIESIIRFGGLGFYFIPWVIMYGIFDSVLLALIAMAFFAIPPIPKERKNSQLFVMYDFYDKIIFGIIMIVVLVLFFNGWEVSKTLSATFIYFWFVTLIAGFFSPAEARPAMGFLMLGAATIIYGIGPGTQEVMSALFGPWWPTIQNMFASITEPIGEAFGGFANTLRSGWLMLTDPVGYATQLMNGTHAANPIGKTGSLGVEITDITISSILPAQPYVITAMIKNEGAFDAENVTVFLSTDYEGADKVRAKGPSKWWGPLLLVKKAWERDILQFRDIFGMDQPFNCWENVSPSEDKCENELTRQNIWQIVFTSETGVSCDVIGYYKLREKAIPLKVAVTYNYSSDSEVDIEFISKNEWQRLAEANQLNQKLRIIQSQYSTAPVEFPIGTPGLKNPILVGQDFHIGMRIEASGTKGSIEHVESVVLEYPSVFVRKGDCTPEGKEEPSGNPDITRMVWRDRSGGSMVVYCPFKGLDPEKLTGPTKTYVVSAHANYTFTKWREKDTRIEFGGKCCDKDDCLQGQECVDGMCVSEGAVGLECDFEPNTRMEFREIPKYKTEIETAVRNNNLASHTDSSYAAEALVAAIIERESSWNPGSKTHEENVNDHSFGLMQIRFETARGLGFPFKDLDTHDNYPCNTNDPSNLCYPARNIDYGTKYLAQRLERATSLRCAISNYNAGSGCPLTKNKDNCNYVKNVLENYYKYYFFYDYCGWREKQNLGKCTLGMGGCTGTTQCDQSVVYGPDDGDKKAPVCRTDLKPKVCCPPSDIFDTNKCQNAFTTWKSQG